MGSESYSLNTSRFTKGTAFARPTHTVLLPPIWCRSTTAWTWCSGGRRAGKWPGWTFSSGWKTLCPDTRCPLRRNTTRERRPPVTHMNVRNESGGLEVARLPEYNKREDNRGGFWSSTSYFQRSPDTDPARPHVWPCAASWRKEERRNRTPCLTWLQHSVCLLIIETESSIMYADSIN